MTLRKLAHASLEIIGCGCAIASLVACSGAGEPPAVSTGSTTTSESVPVSTAASAGAAAGRTTSVGASLAGRPSVPGMNTGTAGRVAQNANAPASTSAGAPANSAAGAPSAAAAGTGAAATGGASAAAAGTSASAAGAGGAVAMGPPDVACDPADKKPDAMVTTAMGLQKSGMPPSGMFESVVEVDPGIVATIFRPEPIGMIQHPVLVFGMGACSNDSTSSGGVFSEMLHEMASHGILVIVDATVGGSGAASTNGSAAGLTKAMDWAEAENERPCSKYYHKLNTKKFATSGQSCGGMNAITTAADPRVAVALPFNSGNFSRDTALYAKLHAPMAIVNSGPEDIAYENGKADFEAIDTIPIMFANYEFNSSFAHNAGFTNQDNSGVFGVLAIAWLNWWLFDDMGPTGKGYFVGDNCGVCSTEWDIQWKMKPM